MVVLDARRYEPSRVQEVVLREALANALAHRSYETSGTAIRVELRPPVVVVRSPGGLPEPVAVENIRETNVARNLVVIRILRALGLAEDAGRGVDVMQDTMEGQGQDRPASDDPRRPCAL
jgi:ATP-dependent DNA helicase RecG